MGGENELLLVYRERWRQEGLATVFQVNHVEKAELSECVKKTEGNTI